MRSGKHYNVANTTENSFVPYESWFYRRTILRNMYFLAGHGWLTLVVLATWEADTGRIRRIRRIVIQSQSRQRTFLRPHLKHWLGAVVCVYYTQLHRRLGSGGSKPRQKKKS
jgi:hypothetical protein